MLKWKLQIHYFHPVFPFLCSKQKSDLLFKKSESLCLCFALLKNERFTQKTKERIPIPVFCTIMPPGKQRVCKMVSCQNSIVCRNLLLYIYIYTLNVYLHHRTVIWMYVYLLFIALPSETYFLQFCYESIIHLYYTVFFYKYYLAIFVRKVRQSVCFSFGPRTVLLLRIRVGPSIHTTSNM